MTRIGFLNGIRREKAESVDCADLQIIRHKNLPKGDISFYHWRNADIIDVTKGGVMKKALSTDDWIIYNCHIHTFTKKHTPNRFFKFILSDSKLGRINWLALPGYLVLVFVYFAFLYIL